MDLRHVCVIIMEIPHGAMELIKVIDYYYDDYFKTNGVVNTLFGDSNSKNRKCNTVFGQ